VTALASGPYALGPLPVLSVRFGLELSLRPANMGVRACLGPGLESHAPPCPIRRLGGFDVPAQELIRQPIWIGIGPKYPCTHTALKALETLGEKPDRAIGPKAARSSWLFEVALSYAAKHLVPRAVNTAFRMRYLASAISFDLVVMFNLALHHSTRAL